MSCLEMPVALLSVSTESTDALYHGIGRVGLWVLDQPAGGRYLYVATMPLRALLGRPRLGPGPTGILYHRFSGLVVGFNPESMTFWFCEHF